MKILSLADKIKSNFNLIRNGEDEKDFIKKGSEVSVVDYLYSLLKKSSDKEENISIKKEAIDIIKKLDEPSFENVFAIFHQVFRDSEKDYGFLQSVTLDVTKPTWKKLKHSLELKHLMEMDRNLNISEDVINEFAEICINRNFNIKSDVTFQDFLQNLEKMDNVLVVEKYEVIQRLKPYLYMNFATENVKKNLELYLTKLKSTWQEDFIRIKNKGGYVVEDESIVFHSLVDLFDSNREKNIEFIKNITKDFLMKESIDFNGLNVILSALVGLEKKYSVKPSEYLEESFFINTIIQVEKDVNNAKIIINNNALNKLKTMAVIQSRNNLDDYFKDVEGFFLYLSKKDKDSYFLPKQDSFPYADYVTDLSNLMECREYNVYFNNNGIIEFIIKTEDTDLIKNLLEAPIRKGFEDINDWVSSQIENYLMKLNIERKKQNFSAIKTRKF